MSGILGGRHPDTFDVFVGSKADNSHWGLEPLMFGYGGNDYLVFAGEIGVGPITMYGGRGADTLHGGANADVLYGGRGHDTLVGVGGDDALYGGRGRDTFVISAGEEAEIKDFQPGKDFIIYA